VTYQEIVQELLAIHKGHTVSNEAYEALVQVVVDQAKRIEELEEQRKPISFL
jgi:hypothetical protein